MPVFNNTKGIRLEAYDFEYRTPTKKEVNEKDDLFTSFNGFTGKNAWLFHMILMAGTPAYPVRLCIAEVVGCTVVIGPPGPDDTKFGAGSTKVYVPPYQQITLIEKGDGLYLKGQILMPDPKSGLLWESEEESK